MSGRARIWWKALRYHFIPPSIFPAVLGGVISWATSEVFSSFYFFLVLVGVIVNHMGVNMTDDYFDYKHAVDRVKTEGANPYAGGSGTLSDGSITPRSMFKAFALCYAVTASIGLYLVAARGLPILVLGLIGVFCSIFYTAPPISFSHHGLGELGLLINFGWVIGLGSYFVQAQRITLASIVATLPMGIMLFSMIVINEIPDYDEDRQAGKMTLVARYGKKAGIHLFVVSWLATYLIVIVAVLTGTIPLPTLLTLLSLPFVYRSVATLRARYLDPVRLAPANLDMIRSHGIACLGLIAGYSIQGITRGADPFQLLFILFVLLISYSPVGLILVRRR